MRGWRQVDSSQDLDGQPDTGRVILGESSIYRAEILVEDIEPVAREALCDKLEAELATSPVTVSELGIRWNLALRVDSEEEAKRIAHEITVTEGRNRGLLLNPNYQQYTLLTLSQIEF